jgi:hypothetical protein
LRAPFEEHEEEVGGPRLIGVSLWSNLKLAIDSRNEEQNRPAKAPPQTSADVPINLLEIFHHAGLE